MKYFLDADPASPAYIYIYVQKEDDGMLIDELVLTEVDKDEQHIEISQEEYEHLHELIRQEEVNQYANFAAALIERHNNEPA